MIKFFRNIRQRLLRENRFTRYLIYALGEIVLVVIGILIALGINQRVQNQKDTDLKNLYIGQLIDEVDQNIKQLSKLIHGNEEMLKDIDTIRQLISKKEFDNPKIGLKSGILIQGRDFQPLQITYENLKFSGDLKLFGDLRLRNTISKAYETINYIKSYEEVDDRVVRIYYEDFLMPKVNLWQMSTSSQVFAQDIYFLNAVASRYVSIDQKIKGYQESIKSFKQLRSTLKELSLDDQIL